MSKPTCYIDVDLTLVDISTDIYPQVVERLKELMIKYKLVAWSAGGEDYAREVLKKNNIDFYFHHILSKPFVVVDDSPESITARATTVKITSQHDWDKYMFWSKLFQKPLGDLCTTSKPLSDT